MTRYRENDDIQSCKCEDAPAQQHCEHEAVCDNFHPEYDPDYQEVCKNPDCPHDTRSRPATSPPDETQMMRDKRMVTFGRETILRELLAYINPDSRAGEVIKEKLDGLKPYGKGWLTDHDAALIAQAREDVLDEVKTKLLKLQSRFAEEEMKDGISLAQSNKMGSARIAIEAAIKLTESLRTGGGK